VLSLWHDPVPLLPDPEEEVKRVEEERAATRQQLVHSWDLKTRQMLGEAVQAVPQVSGLGDAGTGEVGSGGRDSGKVGRDVVGDWGV
jgi:hypothetical protein